MFNTSPFKNWKCPKMLDVSKKNLRIIKDSGYIQNNWKHLKQSWIYPDNIQKSCTYPKSVEYF